MTRLRGQDEEESGALGHRVTVTPTGFFDDPLVSHYVHFTTNADGSWADAQKNSWDLTTWRRDDPLALAKEMWSVPDFQKRRNQGQWKVLCLRS
jgi:hypothetical protein